MQELVMWYNLPFVLPFLAAISYIILLATGTIATDSGVDVDADHDVDVGVDHDADIGADHDMGVEHSTEFSHDHGGDLAQGQHVSFSQQALAFLGIGRTPISILFITICLLWGFFGFASNKILEPILRFPVIFFWISLGVAFFLSLTLTRFLANILARLMPTTETFASGKYDLLGRPAEAVFEISETFGRAQVRDQFGNLQEVTCVVAQGKPNLTKGSDIVLFEYNEQKQVYTACLWGDRQVEE